MADKRNIAVKFLLEGEQKFKQGMKNAADAVKLLNSEEKLAKAQFEQTGDAQEYQAKRVEILKQKIEEQKKAVEAARDALKEMADNGESGTKTAQEWATKLNYANITLTRMQTELAGAQAELDGTSDAMDDASGAAQDFDGELRKIGQGVNYQATIEAIDRVSGALGTIISTAKDAIAAMWNAEMDAAKWADNLATSAAQAGIDVETYQSWVNASEIIDTSVDTIISSRQKLIKKMSDGSEDTMLAFNQLGVVTRNLDGTLRDGTEVFWDVIDALGGIEDPTARDALAMELLGKNTKELNPLIEAGSKKYREIADASREYGVVSEEQVAKLTALDDEHNKLVATLETTKNTILAELAPAFQTVAEAIQQAVQEFKEFLETDEGQAALDGLREALQGIADTITNIDPRDVIDMARKPIEWITNALKWIGENGETVRNISIGIVAAWGGLMIAAPVISFFHLIKSINWTSVGSGAKKLAEAVGGGAETVVKNVVKPAGKAAAALATNPATWAVGAAVGTGAVADVLATERDYGAYNRAAAKENEIMVQEGSAKLEELKGLYADFLALMKEIENAEEVDTYDATKAAADALLAREDELKSALGVDDLGIADYMREGYNPLDGLDWTETAGRVVAELAAAIEEEAAGIPEGLAAGIAQNAETAEVAAGEMAKGVDDAVKSTLDMHSPSRVMIGNGEMVAEGVAQGIYNRAASAIAAARWLAMQVQTVMAGALRINSPSRVMEEMGGYVAQGFALGIEDGAQMVDDAMGRMIQATGATPERPGRRTSAGGGMAVAGEGGDLHAYIVIDRQIVGELVAPVVDGWIGAEIATRR